MVTTLKQGQEVRWVDGMGIEAHGTVDWESLEQEEDKRVPVRSDITGRVLLIERNKLEIAQQSFTLTTIGTSDR